MGPGSDLGSFLMIYDSLHENLNFLYENLNFLYENLRFSLRKIFMIFSMIFLMIHKIRVSLQLELSELEFLHPPGGVETRWLVWQFLNG